jgi:hypothetical protein
MLILKIIKSSRLIVAKALAIGQAIRTPGWHRKLFTSCGLYKNTDNNQAKIYALKAYETATCMKV